MVISLPMTFLGISPLTLLLVLNACVSFLLIIYSYYLFSLERKYKKREQHLDTFATNVIREANEKALHILKNSKYLSENMKKEVSEHFDELLSDLKSQNEEFYTNLQHSYSNTATHVAQLFEKQASEELHAFSDEITKSTQDVKKEFEEVYKNEYAQAHEQIETYKKTEQQRIQNEMRERLKELLPASIAQVLSAEDHEKIVDQVIEKAFHDGYFTSK